MTMNFVAISSNAMLKEAVDLMRDKQQNCILVTDSEDFLEGILTAGDLRRRGFNAGGESCSPKGNSAMSDVCRF